jgi:hypothetical protein
VLEAVPGHRFRRSFRFVLAILGLLALARQSDASGCHVSDRPTFGMDLDSIGDRWTPTPASELTSPAPNHYRQAPCPGESAGLPSKIQVPRASVSTPPLLDRPIEVEPRAIEPADLRIPLDESRPLERPPRDLPAFSSR